MAENATSSPEPLLDLEQAGLNVRADGTIDAVEITIHTANARSQFLIGLDAALDLALRLTAAAVKLRRLRGDLDQPVERAT